MEVKIVDVDSLEQFKENLESVLGGASFVDIDDVLVTLPMGDNGGNIWIDE